jgi:23S rRNA pseudouridine2605 synthase
MPDKNNNKTNNNTNKFRLNRAIAATGFCSRRYADELIRAGKVKVNGDTVVDFNYLVDMTKDMLNVDGYDVSEAPLEYIMMNKPINIVTTCDDDKGRKSVIDMLPPALQHLRPVGRLDMDSEGLLLLTNDGDLAQKLTHPSRHVPKHYRVLVAGEIKDKALDQLANGVRLEEGRTMPAQVELLDRAKDGSFFMLTIEEGRNRQIRRMCAKIGYPVIHLLRVAVGGLQLDGLETGRWRYLTADELADLQADTQTR